MLTLHHGDNLTVLRTLPDAAFRLVYIDPPFNTGKVQARTTTRSVRDEEGGDRVGFHGARYRTIRLGTSSYADWYDDYLAFLEPRLVEALRVLTPDGSLFVHLDAREVHYVKVLLDLLLGRDHFLNEIVWAYDYGGRARRRWSAKHDTLLCYVKDPARYVFRYDDIDRVPYMAPRLVGPAKAARGKTPTDVWWNTIVPPGGREKTGYPTQKPLAIVERIVRVHTDPGDAVLDFFAGSGTLGAAAARLGRSATLVDNNPEAIRVMLARFAGLPVTLHEPGPPPEPLHERPAVDVEEPAVGELQPGDDRERHEGERHVRGAEARPGGLGEGVEPGVGGGDLLPRARGHEPGDGEGEELLDGAVDERQPTAGLHHQRDRAGEGDAVGADGDDVVGVVGD